MTTSASKGTKLQQVINGLAELESWIDDLASDESALASKTDPSTCDTIAAKLKSLQSELSKLVARASEKDPQKRLYNKTKVEKIYGLQFDFCKVEEAFYALEPKLNQLHQLVLPKTDIEASWEPVKTALSKEEPVNERTSIDSVITSSQRLDTDLATASSKPSVSEPSDDFEGNEVASEELTHEAPCISTFDLRTATRKEGKQEHAEFLGFDRSPKTSLGVSDSGRVTFTPVNESTVETATQVDSRQLGIEPSETSPTTTHQTADLQQGQAGSEPGSMSSTNTDTMTPVTVDQRSPPLDKIASASAVSLQQSAESGRKSAGNSAGSSAGTSNQNSKGDKASLGRLQSQRAAWQGSNNLAESAKEMLNVSPQTLGEGGPELMAILQAADRLGSSVLVEFNTSWCGPCRAMKPILSQLAEEFRGRVCIVMIDCEATGANRALAAEAQISAFPTFQLYHGRKRIKEEKGGRPYAVFKAMLDSHLKAFPLKANAGSQGQMEDILTNLNKVITGCTSTVSDQFLRLLLKILENIRNNPDAPKFKCLKASNKKVQDGILAVLWARELLTSIGFFSIQEAGTEVFYGTSVQEETLEETLKLLSEAIDHPQAFQSFVSGPKVEQKSSQVEQKPSETGPRDSTEETSEVQPELKKKAARLAQQFARLFESRPQH